MPALSRRAAVFGLPALAAGPAIAAPGYLSANIEFWTAIAHYQQVYGHLQRRLDAERRLDGYMTDEELDGHLEALDAAVNALLAVPARGPIEALALLTACHSRMYRDGCGVEQGFCGEIERLEAAREWDTADLDRAFLEAAISALKGEN